SQRFLTKPRTPSLSAECCVKKRKPTPWTMPETKYRLANLASLTNQKIVADARCFLLSGQGNSGMLWRVRAASFGLRHPCCRFPDSRGGCMSVRGFAGVALHSQTE